MQTSFIIIGITVSSWAVGMNVLDITGLNDRATAALGGLDWRCWAAHVHPRFVKLRQTKSVRRWEVPLLAGRQATYKLFKTRTIQDWFQGS